MRFASHRDIARAVERGVRKAGIPVAYSAGFSPHPKISYPGGAPTGAASEAEYLQMALTRCVDPAEVRSRLDSALPDGIDVIEVVDLAATPDAVRLDASEWEVTLPGVTPAQAGRAAREFLAAPEAFVQRLTSGGIRQIDARAAVADLSVTTATPREHADAVIRVIIRHVTPAVRADDVLTALRSMAGVAPTSPPQSRRVAQGPLDRLCRDALCGEPAAAGHAAGRHDKTTCLDAGDASVMAPDPDRAYGQLLCGTGRPGRAVRAREPDGRDIPHARYRARQHPAPARAGGEAT